MGAPLAPFGSTIAVCSLAPSRIGIMTSRLPYSRSSVAGLKFAGVSLGRPGYFGGCGRFWADARSKHSATPTAARHPTRTATRGAFRAIWRSFYFRRRRGGRVGRGGRGGRGGRVGLVGRVGRVVQAEAILRRTE